MPPDEAGFATILQTLTFTYSFAMSVTIPLRGLAETVTLITISARGMPVLLKMQCIRSETGVNAGFEPLFPARRFAPPRAKVGSQVNGFVSRGSHMATLRHQDSIGWEFKELQGSTDSDYNRFWEESKVPGFKVSGFWFLVSGETWHCSRFHGFTVNVAGASVWLDAPWVQLIIGTSYEALRWLFRKSLINRHFHVECWKRQLPLLSNAERFARHQEAKASVAFHLGRGGAIGCCLSMRGSWPNPGRFRDGVFVVQHGGSSRFRSTCRVSKRNLSVPHPK